MTAVVSCVIIAAAIIIVLWIIAPLDEHHGAHRTGQRQAPAPESNPPMTSMPPTAEESRRIAFGQAEPAEDNPPEPREPAAPGLADVRDELVGALPVADASAAAASDTAQAAALARPLWAVRADGVIHVDADGHISGRKLIRVPGGCTGHTPAHGLPPLPQPLAIVRPYLDARPLGLADLGPAHERPFSERVTTN